MKFLMILALLVPTLLHGQSAIPKAVNETVNITARNKKGDLQRYQIITETRALDEDATPLSYKRDVLGYSQYCSGNSPEMGLEYRITIDSFAVGFNGTIEQPDLRLQVVRQLDGYPISSQFTRSLPRKNDCYDLGLNIPDSLIYVEIFEFSEIYKFSRLLEQLRFTAGSQLNKIGDSAVISFPNPICMDVEKVVNSYNLKLAPQVVELTGLTNMQNRACAIITVKSSTSPLKIDLWSGPELSYVWNGTLTITAGLVVALDDGDILFARVMERADARVIGPNGRTAPSHRVKTFEIRQLN